MSKETSKKPKYVDTRFRQRGQFYGQCVTLEPCYECPCCKRYIFFNYEDACYCQYCGQKLDWEGRTLHD